MSGRAPAYRDPVLHLDAPRLVKLREGGRIEETLATGKERGMPIRAPAHVHPVHAAICCWSTAYSSLPARSANWLDGPCLAFCSCIWGVVLDLTFLHLCTSVPISLRAGNPWGVMYRLILPSLAPFWLLILRCTRAVAAAGESSSPPPLGIVALQRQRPLVHQTARATSPLGLGSKARASPSQLHLQ
jgi:hypothetical protein